ncbi:I78 family peptidase inhibitor [Thioclava pacifica]|uniref:Peptidase inhibitor I78 family protein n=1 Tax=Thioclava pacifica DSM 10166 TaxID=1353537 RepID=A0A074J6G5_9RHOB|nr:I78 family peptidase inhibitor [Thioclava pacifica]KEO51173.1 hypothetical protein TP2_12320 [Thioclava pacifica DSM 10166]
MLRPFSAIAAVLVLAACNPDTALEDTPDQAMPSPAPHMTPSVTVNAGGLEEREPDTCGAVNYISVLGQPASQIQTLTITRPYRIVEWRGVEDQIYNPQRVVFRLDGAGNIYNIDCG